MTWAEKIKKQTDEDNRKKAEEAKSVATSPITGQRIGIVTPTREVPKAYGYAQELGKSIAEGYRILAQPTDYARKYWAGRTGIGGVLPTPTTPVTTTTPVGAMGAGEWTPWTPERETPVEKDKRILAGINVGLATENPPTSEQIGLDLAGRPPSTEPPTAIDETWTPAMKAMYARSPQRTVQSLADTGHTFTNADLLAMGGKPSTLTDEENLAIIRKNREDYSRALDESIAGQNERAMRDTILRATNQPTPENIAAAKIAEANLSGMPAFAKERREAGISAPDYATAVKDAIAIEQAKRRPIAEEIEVMKVQHPAEKLQIDKLTSGFMKKTYNVDTGLPESDSLDTGAFYGYLKTNPQLGITPPESWNPVSNMGNITGYSQADILAEKKRRGLIK